MLEPSHQPTTISVRPLLNYCLTIAQLLLNHCYRFPTTDDRRPFSVLWWFKTSCPITVGSCMMVRRNWAKKWGLGMNGGVVRYYFLLEEDAQLFAQQLNGPLAEAGFQPCHSFNDSQRKAPFAPSYWQYTAFDTHILAIANQVQDGNWQRAWREISALEQQAQVDLDIILGQTTTIISTHPSREDILEQCQLVKKNHIEREIGVKNGRLARYGMSAGQSCYIANLKSLDSTSLAFLAHKLSLLEAQHLNLRMITRLLKEQEHSVSQESAVLDRELSLALHANLVSASSEQKEAEELAGQLQRLAGSYGKVAGSRHLIATGRGRLQTLLKQFTRSLSNETELLAQPSPFTAWARDYQDFLERLNLLEGNLYASQQNYQAAIGVVQSRIDMMNSRSNLATQAKIRNLMEQNTNLQKQSLVFQYAAGLIEFIVLAYYSHSLWKNLAPQAYLSVPASLQFMVVLLFSGSAVYCTHLLAEYMQGETEAGRKIALPLVFLALLVMVIIAGSVMVG